MDYATEKWLTPGRHRMSAISNDPSDEWEG